MADDVTMADVLAELKALRAEQTAIARQSGYMTDDELAAVVRKNAVSAKLGGAQVHLTPAQEQMGAALVREQDEAQAEADRVAADQARRERDMAWARQEAEQLKPRVEEASLEHRLALTRGDTVAAAAKKGDLDRLVNALQQAEEAAADPLAATQYRWSAQHGRAA